jgi:hypothetical protein
MFKKVMVCLMFILILSACSSLSSTKSKDVSQRYSIQFDGENDLIDAGDPNCLEMGLDSYTFELWFKTGRQNYQQQLIRKGYNNRALNEGRWVLSIDKSNVIRIIVDDVNNTIFNNYRGLGNSIVTDNRWHHLAVVFDRDSALVVYLDGRLEMHDTKFRNMSYSIHNNEKVNVYLGRSNDDRFYFKGNIYDVRIWNCLRTRQDIIANMFTEFTGKEDNLICYYKMTEGKGQILYDHASKNHAQFGSTPDEDENDPEWSDSLPQKH